MEEWEQRQEQTDTEQWWDMAASMDTPGKFVHAHILMDERSKVAESNKPMTGGMNRCIPSLTRIVEGDMFVKHNTLDPTQHSSE